MYLAGEVTMDTSRASLYLQHHRLRGRLLFVFLFFIILVTLEASGSSGDATTRPQETAATLVKASPDGRWICVVDPLHHVSLWDSVSGDQPTDIHSSHGRATKISWTRDSNLFAIGHWNGTVAIWSVGRQQWIRQIEAHSGKVIEMQFSRDGTLLATIAADEKARVWEVETGRLVSEQNEGPPFIQKLAFCHGDRLLAAVGAIPWGFRLMSAGDGSDVGTRAPNVLLLPGDDLEVSSDSNFIAAMGFVDNDVNWSVVVLDISAQRLAVHRLAPSEGEFTQDPRFSEDGKWLLAGSSYLHGQTGRQRSGFHLWSTVTGELRQTIGIEGGFQPIAMAIAPSAHQVAAADFGSSVVCVWEVQTGKISASFDTQSSVDHLVFARGGNLLVGVSEDAEVSVWDLSTARLVGQMNLKAARESN
jgi:eukaryotic-like serine/threonine-protein kinase